MGAITKVKICSKYVPAELSFSFPQRTSAKLLCFRFLDISVFFKNVRNLPDIPGSHKRHYQVEVQLFAKRSGSSATVAVRHILIQTKLADRFEERWQKFPISGPSSCSEQVVVSDLVQLAN